MTLSLNYAVSFTSTSNPTSSMSSNSDNALSLLERLSDILNTATDSETVYRALVASGTLLFVNTDIKLAGKEILGLNEVGKRVSGKFKEPRIRGIVGEVEQILK
jgi:phospholipase A-2-activating protein